ncbi:helix-turn-helix transcriptional regulator [Blastococcus sp. BMG 814]|uniref:Helix-turn-helix transcriptional regulator n=1 Tax=Blastococcus carthaginiensis TaxID=3050034 RepID=A0ABT9I9F8_9ACTN|nr:helix-turn-helix transcriptional regulator [Blastococcus carthaginiensis]MDP5182194.1 helix-turn-helix transcriptional regulator [Blastococcus carthaginiensis]
MPEGLAAAVAEQIRRLMLAHNVSGNALAGATGIPQRNISRKLKGESDFGLDEVQRIAEHFGVDPEDLVAWARRGVHSSE